MNSFQQISETRHEYRLKGWQRWLFILLGGVMAAGGVFVSILAFANSANPFEAIMPLFLIGIGIYLAAYALRSRLVIDGARIEVRGALKEYTADFSQIEGFRTISSRNGSYTQLSLKEGRGKITISQSFDTDDEYRAWFQQLTDLDARDRDALLAEISRDAELGSTPEERLNALKQAKTINILAIVVTIAAAAGLNFGAVNLRLPSAVVLALMPVAVLLLIQRSPLLYEFFKKKADPRAEVSFVLMAAGLGLLFRIRETEFVSLQPLLFLIVPVALVFLAAFFNSARKNSSPAGAFIGLLFFAGIYSYGLAVVMDTVADRSNAATYMVSVMGKHESHGKSTTYYLELAPWGPVEEPNKLSVSSSIYSNTEAGDSICLALHPGRLHAQWYQLAACPAEPAQQPAQ
jgi:hypothetical protein